LVVRTVDWGAFTGKKFVKSEYEVAEIEPDSSPS
jgi:hypothetical protein